MAIQYIQIFRKNWVIILFITLISQSLTAQTLKNDFIEGKTNFPILAWDFLGSPDYSLKDISECNFTIAGFIRPYDLNRVEEHGLQAIVDMDLNNWGTSLHRRIWRNLSDEEIDSRIRLLIENSGKSEAIIGYFIMDEPSVLDFPYLGKAVKAVKKYAPDKLAYINLFPNYATLSSIDKMNSQLGTKTYTEYLERFVNEVKPQFISYDNYMVQYSMDLKEEKRAISYFTNLLEVRRVALKYNLPYWNIVSSHQVRKNTTIPSLANMLFQAYTSLAAGYKGISWYQYNQNGYNYSPINKEQEKTSTWFYLKEVNRQILSLGPLINQLTSTGVYFTPSFLSYDFPTLPGEIVDSLNCDAPMMIGEFIDNKDNRYAMIVNLNLDRSVKFTLSTKSGKENIFLIIPSNKNDHLPLVRKNDMNNHNDNYWLTAGEGILIKFENDNH